MPRPKEFEPQDALHKAMLVFWQKGYLDTSMEDLVQATSVSRYGLYSTFGDKQDLFQKAMGHYANTVINTLMRPLEATTASVVTIHDYFNTLITMSQTTQGPVGCLIGNTAVEITAPNEAITAIINSHYNRMRNAFRHALQNGQQQTQIPATVDLDAYADYCIGLANGLLLSMHAQIPLSALQNMVNIALTILPNKSP